MRGRSQTIFCKMLIFNRRGPFRVHVIAPKAPPDELACVELITATSAMGHWLGCLLACFRFGVGVGCRFENEGFLFGFVLRAGTEFNRTITVIVSLHREVADAVAIGFALPIVSGDVAKMSVHTFQYSSGSNSVVLNWSASVMTQIVVPLPKV
jgi:hypothetical protein